MVICAFHSWEMELYFGFHALLIYIQGWYGIRETAEENNNTNLYTNHEFSH
jgi:hypothetical protein